MRLFLLVNYFISVVPSAGHFVKVAEVKKLKLDRFFLRSAGPIFFSRHLIVHVSILFAMFPDYLLFQNIFVLAHAKSTNP